MSLNLYDYLVGIGDDILIFECVGQEASLDQSDSMIHYRAVEHVKMCFWFKHWAPAHRNMKMRICNSDKVFHSLH